MESREAKWKRYHQLLCDALNPEPASPHYSQLSRALTRLRKGSKGTLSETERHRWFSFDSFLELLGLVSINQESSGGLYALHCHLNHSCEPNIQVCYMKVRQLRYRFAIYLELSGRLHPYLAISLRQTSQEVPIA